MLVIKIMKFVVLLMALTGCSTMTKEDCSIGNWSFIGERDARYGELKSNFYYYQKKCLKFGVSGNKEEYLRGYSEGLGVYCTYENGYEVGNAGEDYSKICPSKSSKDFLKGFISGKRIYEQRQEYERRLKFQQEEMQRSLEFRERLLGNVKKKTCIFDSDCRTRGKCRNDKCSHTGKTCMLDYDCRVVGVCNNNKCEF